MEQRYEAYDDFPEGIPFVYRPHIHRSAKERSRQSNWHENLELEYCESGEGSVLIDGERYPLRAGDLVAICGNRIHHTGTDTDLVYTCLIFDPAFCAQNGLPIEQCLPKEHFTDPHIADAIASIHRIYKDRTDPLRVPKLRSLALTILLGIMEHHLSAAHAPRPQSTAEENVKNAIRYIRMHYREKLSLDAMAAALFVNKYVLLRQFKRITRQTVTEDWNAHRCRCAAALLAEGKSVAEAATQCGFSNLSYFSKTFARYRGILPSEYRKKRGNRGLPLDNFHKIK